MNKESTFCTHCQKDVHFVMTPTHHDGQANLPEGHEIVCLDFDEACEGGICPLSGLPPIFMGVRLGQSGEERAEPWTVVNAVCEECNMPTELKVLDQKRGLCSVCGSINRLVMIRLQDGSYVAGTGQQP
ncbi:MAG: hypothetical protein ABFS14_04915 [Gemmatimonadota bacterium]